MDSQINKTEEPTKEVEMTGSSPTTSQPFSEDVKECARLSELIVESEAKRRIILLRAVGIYASPLREFAEEVWYSDIPTTGSFQTLAEAEVMRRVKEDPEARALWERVYNGGKIL